MSVKSTLKTVKLNESLISMILGAIVIVAAGLLIVNFFRRDTGSTVPTGEVAVENSQGDASTTQGSKTYVVQEGDTLWKIAERFYNSGYNWIDIVEANNLKSADDISAGQELIIPETKDGKLASASITPTEAPKATVTPSLTATPEPTKKSEATPTPTPIKSTDKIAGATDNGEAVDGKDPISGATYTVVRGDTLWHIAIRAYGDGYRWVEIAKANNLKNPDLIHPGNTFTIPR